ncbi:MAG: MaoC family dehydratase [Salinirussus sp.]
MTDAYHTDLTIDDVSVGDGGPTLMIDDLERKDFVQYAGASGDFNPIHYDVPYARSAGNPDVFAQGMLTAGFGAHMIADWFGLKNIRTYGVRFQDRVYPGDSLEITGEITAVDETDRTVDADLVATNDAEDPVLSGSVSALVPES